jgi:hypothetical protein
LTTGAAAPRRTETHRHRNNLVKTPGCILFRRAAPKNELTRRLTDFIIKINAIE